MADASNTTSKIRIDKISPEETQAAIEAGAALRALRESGGLVRKIYTWHVRFFALVDVREKDTCWPWLGQRKPTGHGRFQASKFEKTGAHQIAYLLSKGRIPDGLCVCHSCDNGWCCNPAHLWLGTRLENHEDCTAKGRRKGQSNRTRGSQSHLSKLTEDQVTQILRSDANNLELAEQFGVHAAHISKIRTKRAWKHLAA